MKLMFAVLLCSPALVSLVANASGETRCVGGTDPMCAAGEDVDCKGGYGAWSECEPLEGHDTHHDAEDDFNLQRGPDGYFVGECFQYRTYHIITPPRGNGNKCSKKDGSKLFRYCADCSALPANYKRLDAPPVVSAMRFFAVIAGIISLVAIVVFVAICLRKMFSEGSQRQEIPFYPPESTQSANGCSMKPCPPCVNLDP